jgi:hypothetical protein
VLELGVRHARVAQIWHNLLFNAVNEKPNVPCCTVLYCTVLQSIRRLPVIARRKDALTFACNGWTLAAPAPSSTDCFSLSKIWRLPVESACNPPVFYHWHLFAASSSPNEQAPSQSHLHLHHPSYPFIVGFISFQRCPILRLYFNSIFTYLDTRRPVSDPWEPRTLVGSP